MTVYPRYLELYETGELEHRVRRAVDSLESCRTCPWECAVNRLEDETKVCRIGRYARVTSCFPHRGEEPPIRGWNGSGTIFFAGCNLRCVFCQNYSISHVVSGNETPPESLAAMMISLQKQGCHNINFVTPEHVVPQILEALPPAIERGLRIPIVYNTSGYDSPESLSLLDGIVDLYMPDFKYWSPDTAKRYLKCRDYPRAAREALCEMHRQVGDLEMDDRGIARSGLLIRHLVMPDALEDTRRIMAFIARELSPGTYVNIMAQYHPAGEITEEKYPELNRRLTRSEWKSAVSAAEEAGLHRFDGV